MAMTGTITVLFTDLVGSTELLSGLGDDAADELRRAYFKILRDTVTRHSGREVKNLGDGIMAVFASAIDALHCAIDIQRTVQAHNHEKDASLGVRIGLEVGEPIAEEEDYFGTPVVVAKRLCDSAQGGQIIVSELVSRLVGSRGRFDFKDIGLLSLRGIDEAIAAREVAWYPSAGSEPSGPEPDRVLQLDGSPRWGKKMGTTVEARRKPRLVSRFLAASILLALAVIVVYAFVTSRDDDAAPGREPSESAGEPGDGSRTPLDRLNWKRVADVNGSLGGPFDQGINRIEATRDQLVAVGHTESSPDDLDGAVWISDDGAQWARASSSTENPFSGPGDQEISGVRARGRGLIAVGKDGQATGPSEDFAAAVWVSHGNDWQRVSHNEIVFDGAGTQYMNRVVPYGGDGWVAIGATWDATPGSERDGALWTSATGRNSWVLRQKDDGTFAGPGTQDIRSVARNADTLIAAGTDGRGGDLDGALWRSVGVVWSRVKAGEDVLGGAGDQQIITVEPHRRGFVAVGHDEVDGEGDAAVWLSRDGKSWQRVPSRGDLGGHGDQMMLGVTSTPAGLVAVGRVTHTDGEIDGAVWTSVDGTSWKLQTSRTYALPGSEQQIKWVAADDAHLIAGGWVGRPGGDLDAAVWRARLPQPE